MKKIGGWINTYLEKRKVKLIGIKNKKQAEEYTAWLYHKQMSDESTLKNRTLFDMKFGRPYNTGGFK